MERALWLPPSMSLSSGTIIFLMRKKLPDDAIDKKNDWAVAIVAFDDGFEAFLSRSVPYLQFNIELIIDFDDFGSKLNSYIWSEYTNSDCVRANENILSVSSQQATLAWPWHPYHDDLELSVLWLRYSFPTHYYILWRFIFYYFADIFMKKNTAAPARNKAPFNPKDF